MITKFIDREDELRFLERKYEDKRAQLIIKYLLDSYGLVYRDDGK